MYADADMPGLQPDLLPVFIIGYHVIPDIQAGFDDVENMIGIRGGNTARAHIRIADGLYLFKIMFLNDIIKGNETGVEFFQQVLGPRLKYSCAWWGVGTTTLADAEVAALDQTIGHADLADGMRILELGCGWGSLTLEMAARFPASSIVAVSNSASQRRFIEAEARRRRLANVVVETADINAYEPRGTFDRIVSVEMLEHVRNHQALFARLARWLRPDGRLFVHVFCHRRFAYTFDAAGAADWMARHFFSGGLMPSLGLLPAVPSRFRLEATWRWDGRHYARTANAWLANLDGAVDDLGALLAPDPVEASRALRRWRLFFLACAELFATHGGEEWGVAHYRFAPEHTEGR